MKCHLPFASGKDAIYNNGGKKYCKVCCTREFGKTCHKCSRPISPFNEGGAVVHKGWDYHNACFGKALLLIEFYISLTNYILSLFRLQESVPRWRSGVFWKNE